jgi:ferredoxin-NADP reductase
LEELEPSYELYADLGINLPRAYTLASWENNNEYIDLCISTLDNGLTSTFLKTCPKTLRISSFESTFANPQKPLIMIANGSGIAPFRSIIEYMAEQ